MNNIVTIDGKYQFDLSGRTIKEYESIISKMILDEWGQKHTVIGRFPSNVSRYEFNLRKIFYDFVFNEKHLALKEIVMSSEDFINVSFSGLSKEQKLEIYNKLFNDIMPYFQVVNYEKNFRFMLREMVYFITGYKNSDVPNQIIPFLIERINSFESGVVIPISEITYGFDLNDFKYDIAGFKRIGCLKETKVPFSFIKIKNIPVGITREDYSNKYVVEQTKQKYGLK